MRHRKHMQVKPSVMIECLVAEGIVWAGWYRPENLRSKWDEVQGNFMNGSLQRYRRTVGW